MIASKGTELYIKDQGVTKKVACVSNIDGLSENMQMRDRTTLCDASQQSEPSHPERGQLNFSTRLTYDSALLIDAQRAKRLVRIVVGLSDGTAAHPSTSRSWIEFDGYIVGFSTNIQVGTVLPLSFSVQIQSDINITIKS